MHALTGVHPMLALPAMIAAAHWGETDHAVAVVDQALCRQLYLKVHDSVKNLHRNCMQGVAIINACHPGGSGMWLLHA